MPNPKHTDSFVNRDLRLVLSVLAVCMVLAGCASTPMLSADARAHLMQVRISPDTKTATEMYYYGPDNTFGILIGGIGGAVPVAGAAVGLIGAISLGAANMSAGERLHKLAEDNGIRIDQIAREEATKAFQESGKVELTADEGANVSTLKLSIPVYGFTIPSGLSFSLIPMMRIECELVDPSGKTVWRAYEMMGSLKNPAERRSSDEFYANPKLIEESWRTAMRSVMTDIATHF